MKKHSFLWLVITGLCLATVQHLSAKERTYNVLFIQSYTNHTSWNGQLIKGLKDGLADGGVKTQVVTEYLDANFWSYPAERVIMRRMCERARQRGTNLIVTSSDEAFYTLMNCGDSLPYRLPVVVSGIKYPDNRLMSSLPNVCGYTSKADFGILLETAHQFFPNRTEIVCLADSSILSRKGAEALEQSWAVFQKSYPDYSYEQYNVQTSSPNLVIASICYEYNAYNSIVIAPKWSPFLSFIGKNSKAPFFAAENGALTNGVFCVHDAEPYTAMLAAGKQAAQVLKGASPASLGITNLQGGLLYDYKQLDFFHVKENKTIDKGTVMNIPAEERYQWWYVLLYLVIMTGLIALVIRLYLMSHKEVRKRMHAQTRLLIQSRLIEQRDEFDNIFCSIRDGLITYDTDLRIHFVNRALMVMLGFDPKTHTGRYYEGQIAGSIFHIYMNGEDILHRLLKQVREEKMPFQIPEKTFMQERVSGTYFPVSGEVIPVMAKDKLMGMAICCRNISEEEMQKRFFNLAIEESSVYPWQCDVRSLKFHLSESLLKRLNLSEDKPYFFREELGKMIHPKDFLQTRSSFDSILLGHDQNSRINFRLKNAEGVYEWWELRGSIYDGMSSDSPYMVMGILQNIQRYKNTEEELIQARDCALQADKLKSAFLANMSHEIRTPLNAIVGFSDLLQDVESFTSEEVKQFVETINTNCTLLLALINDILDLSRIESGTMDFQFTALNLTYVMQQVYESQCLNMPLGVKLVIDVPEKEKTVTADTVRLKQVMNNLINNAKKFTTHGSITFGYEEQEPNYTVFFVEDTGAGISPENQKRIFERFYKADSFTQGAGLGLSICQTIVSRFHGKISVLSTLGKGTRFMVRIPNNQEA